MNSVNPTVPAHIAVVERFLEYCHTKRYSSGNRIIHTGDASDTLYFITRGSVRVMIESETGHEMVLAYLNKGDFFAEMGYLKKMRVVH